MVMQIDTQLAVVIGGPAVAVIVWLVRLEGRQNLSEARYADIKAQLEKLDHKLDTVLER